MDSRLNTGNTAQFKDSALILPSPINGNKVLSAFSG